MQSRSRPYRAARPWESADEGALRFGTMTDRRILLVHAHPDDETIGTGIAMARYVDEGVGVTLVTCTLGEEGEILVPGLEHLASDQEDRLGDHRYGELTEAMRLLGVEDWRLLGGRGRYRDSGMVGTPPNERAEAFWRSDLLEAIHREFGRAGVSIPFPQRDLHVYHHDADGRPLPQLAAAATDPDA